MSDLQIITLRTGPMDNNTYGLVDTDSGSAAIIDPTFGGSEILKMLPFGCNVKAIWLTHGHFDHVAEVPLLKQSTGAMVGIHAADEVLMVRAEEIAAMFGVEVPEIQPPDIHIQPFDVLTLGKSKIEVRSTPGHSPGGVSFVAAGSIIVGDCLFSGAIGRTDLPGGNMDILLKSIHEQILSLSDDTAILPGHGPATTVFKERTTNPFLV